MLKLGSNFYFDLDIIKETVEEDIIVEEVTFTNKGQGQGD
jgi:hypothetical protein